MDKNTMEAKTGAEAYWVPSAKTAGTYFRLIYANQREMSRASCPALCCKGDRPNFTYYYPYDFL